MDRSVRRRQIWSLRAVRILSGLLLLCGGMLLWEMPGCHGQETTDRYFVNSDTGYQIFVEDEAELLTEGQRRELAEEMKKITAYGNAAFVTTQSNASSTESFARSYYRSRFGTDSGTVFVIDMDNRNIWIHSDGEVYKVITSAYADTITDNVYRYAANGDYYGCASEAFHQIDALLQGQRIAQPMKYISNALLAVILAMLANFGLVIGMTRLRKPGERAVDCQVKLTHFFI